MFSFRKRAEETDKYLKVKCKELLKSSEITMKVLNTSVSIKTNKGYIKDVTSTKNSFPSLSVIPKISIKPFFTKSTTELPVKIDRENEQHNNMETEINPILATKGIPKSTKKKVHSSIDEIFATYENIKIPSACLPLDLNPCVCMEMDDVENYFRLNSLDMNKAVQTVLKSLRATKKTAAINKNTSSGVNVEGNKTDLINEERRGSPMAFKVAADDKSQLIVIAKNSLKHKIHDSDSENKPKTKTNKANLKRRRLSSRDISIENELQQPTSHDSLALKPKDVFVHRCNVCRCPQINAKSLREHVKEHFKCKFCRTKFRILDQKENHEKKCKHKQRLTSTPYVSLERVDNILKQLMKSPVVEIKKTDAISLTENLSHRTSKNQEGDKIDEVIELSDDDSNENNLTDNVPSVSATTPIISVVNNVKPNNIIHSKVPDRDVPKLMPLDNFSVTQPIQYTSTGIVKPAIEIKDNTMLNSIDTSSSDVKVLKELLINTIPVPLKLCVDGEFQTDLPSNDQIIKDTSTNTAELKDLLRQLFVYKIPIEIQKGDFNITYNKSKTPEKKNKRQFWNRTKATDIKFNNFTYFNTNNLNKHITQGISLLQPVSQTPHVPQPVVLNSTLAGIPLRQQNDQSSHPLYFSKALVNINQKISHSSIYSTNDFNSVPSNFYPNAPTTFFNSNPLQAVSSDVNPNLNNSMTYVTQNTVSNSNLQSYVNASANITSSNSMYESNSAQNLNLPLTYTNANDHSQSIPLSSLTDSSASNNVVLSTVPNIQSDVSSIPAAVLPNINSNTYVYSSNVNMPSNNVFGNTLAPACYNIGADSNVGVHNDFMSSSMSQAATSNVQNANKIVQMPLIRVRNICELK